MKLLLTTILLFSLAVPAGGSNRADVNADHQVNAVDQLVIAHILAGNLDAGNYDLANVVVVAPKGGDFTDPADAADWVSLQNPTASRSFVILVTPGYYTLNRAVELPAYTILKGYGRERTILKRDMSETDPPYGAVVSCDGASFASLDGLWLTKTYNPGGGHNSGLYIRNCEVTVRGCRIEVDAGNASAKGIYLVSESGGAAYLNLDDSLVTVTQSAAGTGSAYGIQFMRAGGDIKRSSVDCANWIPGGLSYTLYQNSFGTGAVSVIWANSSDLSAYGHAQGRHYYLCRPPLSGHDEAYFYYCDIRGESSSSTLVFHVYCHSGTNLFP